MNVYLVYREIEENEIIVNSFDNYDDAAAWCYEASASTGYSHWVEEKIEIISASSSFFACV